MNTLGAGFLAIPLVLATSPALADLELPDASPLAKVVQTVGLTEIEVTYHSPAMKGRTIWGDLVPFDKVWRTGANKNTLIRFSGPVSVAGQSVAAGTYSVHTIPGKDAWTLILNGKTDGWGTESYEKAKDVARVTVKPSAAPIMERLRFVFADTAMGKTHLDLEWAGLRVRIPITTETDKQVAGNITRAVDGLWRTPARAARHLYDNNGDLKQAGTLIDRSVALKATWYNLMIKGWIAAKEGDAAGAIATTKKALEMGDDSNGFKFYSTQMKASLEKWGQSS